jgi:hypothetical protein
MPLQQYQVRHGALDQWRVQIVGATTGRLFAADDWITGDRYVGADFGDIPRVIPGGASPPMPPRHNFFLLQLRGEQYLIYNPETDSYLFCSNDTSGQDNLIEAHGSSHVAERRNEFDFQPLDNGLYRIYSPSYDRYLFVSNDTKGDYTYKLVEAHSPNHVSESRNEFRLDRQGF